MRGIFRHPPQPQQLVQYFPLPDVAIIPTAVQPRRFVPRAVRYRESGAHPDRGCQPAERPGAVHQPRAAISSERGFEPAECARPDRLADSDHHSERGSDAEERPGATVRGNTQYINVFGVPSRQSVPIPVVQGGNTSLRIWIGGTDVTLLTGGLNGGWRQWEPQATPVRHKSRPRRSGARP